eukprot:TRINITY_DN19193_c0_g1_i1.p1 TRINITY_DN19193_c0_g1~~TRINITY_DN19193_c0_g1_i1.p1  ORF type:complete len:204 (+),score=49.51 TRINITY_DN19193_c0_g1_i1:3-614(+)
MLSESVLQSRGNLRSIKGLGRNRTQALGRIYSSVLPEISSRPRRQQLKYHRELNIQVSISPADEDSRNIEELQDYEEDYNTTEENVFRSLLEEELNEESLPRSLHRIEITDFDSVLDERSESPGVDLASLQSGTRAPPITPIVTVREYFEEDQDSGIGKNEEVQKPHEESQGESKKKSQKENSSSPDGRPGLKKIFKRPYCCW